MYTLEEVIEKFYDSSKDYEGMIKKNYKGETGLSKQDGEDVLYAIKEVRLGNVNLAIDFLQSRDSEVREVFTRMLIDDPNYDWNGNRVK